MNDQEILHRRIEIGKVFTPSAPIDRKALFAGRKKQIESLINAVTQKGRHAVLFGERGVGKTSLANIVKELMGSYNIAVASTNCEAASTYTSIWGHVFNDFPMEVRETGMGFNPTPHVTHTTTAAWLSGAPNAEEVRQVLQKMRMPTIIIIDEIDRVSDLPTITSIADTIKTLSDHSVDSTIILVGVADSVDSLINEHLSIERALVQIPMPRMTNDELMEVVTKGLGLLGMTIDRKVAERICRLSNGLPHYTHTLSLHAAQAAVSAGKLHISEAHLGAAINESIDQAQQSIVRSYHQATSSPRGKLYPEVLLACALAKTDELGYFPAGNIREPLTKLMSKAYDIPAFSQHLNNFCEQDRGQVLQRAGFPRRYKFRFTNPLMEPFVIMKGLVRGKITSEDIDALKGSGLGSL